MSDIAAASLPRRLNEGCFCITLDRDALSRALEREADDPEFYATFIAARPHLFSNTPLFLGRADSESMLRVVRAIEAAARLPGYREKILAWAPEIARHDFGPRGMFMGYDFHLTKGGPKLIEVNTNAGGAFLNALLAKAQYACCAEIEAGLSRSQAHDFSAAVLHMLEREWLLQRGAGAARRIAIVDDRPLEQFLYPEFLLAQRLLARHGIDALIADPRDLRFADGRLFCAERPIDLVYNRLVDFAFDEPGHEALRDAYRAGAVVVSPNPHLHALFADKRNLTLLSDQAALRSFGLGAELLAALVAIPRTVLVTPESSEELWQARKRWFFKPAGGYGSKAVYRGDKVTRTVWAEIIRGGYVAQELAAPGERMIELDGVREARKTDVRLYVYDGEVLLTAARLYQGQTTNMRTPGGGFAPVFEI